MDSSPTTARSRFEGFFKFPVTPWFGFLVLAATFASLTAWSWRKWPDVFVDFASQLYVPWQIAKGRDLYRDLEYIGGGPFSQYYHAFVFKLFGVSLLALIVSSLTWLAGITVCIYQLFRNISDAFTATAVCLMLLLVFSFSEYVWVGNYNYICAYSSEAVHGLFVALLAVGLLVRWLNKQSVLSAAAGGGALAFVFLTKPDIFLALSVTVTAAFGLAWKRQLAKPFRNRSVLAFVCGTALVLALSIGFFCLRGFAAREALLAAAGAWTGLFQTGAPKDSFYKWCMGLDAPLQNARTMLLWFVGYAGAVATIAWCCCQFSRRNKTSERVIISLILAGVALGAIDVPWAECGWPMPLATLVIGMHLLWTLWKQGDSAETHLALPILWSIFSLLLMLKIILHPRIWHYGFYLAMPAVLLNVWYLLWWLPRWLRSRGLHQALFRGVIMLILGIAAFRLVRASNAFYAIKTYSVGPSADRIVTFPPNFYPRSEGIAATAKWIEQNTKPDATVAVVPDGLILNYLTRRANPTRYSIITPLEIAADGEKKIVESFQARAPDYIVLMHRSSVEFGVKYFGQDPAYGALFMQWVREAYEPAFLWGSEPLQNEQFGIKVMKRKTAGAR